MQTRAPFWSLIAIMLLIMSGPAFGAGGGSSSTAPATPVDPNYAAGQTAVESAQWQQAISAFEKVVETDPNNADALNYLGYSHRQLGALDVAFDYYRQALTVNNDHRGAHEYIGQAYLMSGNLEKAKEHLAVLDDLCFFGCAEYDSLKKAIQDFEVKKASG